MLLEPQSLPNLQAKQWGPRAGSSLAQGHEAELGKAKTGGLFLSCTGSRACGLSTLDTLLPQRPPQEWCLHRWSSHTWTHPRGHCRVRQTLWTLKGVSPPPKSSRSDKSRARRQVFTLLWERTVFPKNGAGPTGPPYTKEGTWTLTSHYTQKVIKTRPKS